MRKALYSLHKWTALFTSAILVVVGVTGCLLVFELRMDRWLDPAVSYVAPAPATVAFSKMLASNAKWWYLFINGFKANNVYLFNDILHTIGVFVSYLTLFLIYKTYSNESILREIFYNNLFSILELVDQGIDVTILWYNPNIQPKQARTAHYRTVQ